MSTMSHCLGTVHATGPSAFLKLPRVLPCTTDVDRGPGTLLLAEYQVHLSISLSRPPVHTRVWSGWRETLRASRGRGWQAYGAQASYAWSPEREPGVGLHGGIYYISVTTTLT